MITSLLQLFALTSCDPAKDGASFFEFPHWYEYLHEGTLDAFNKCVPKISNINDTWLIVLAGIDILLRLAGLVAFGAVLYGGIRYLTSQGEPDKTKQAKDTIINGLIGAVIAILAASTVRFVAGRFGV